MPASNCPECAAGLAPIRVPVEHCKLRFFVHVHWNGPYEVLCPECDAKVQLVANAYTS